MATFEYKITSKLVSNDEIICNDPVIAARYLADRCFDRDSMHEESAFVLLLDKSCHLQGFSRISTGCADSCTIDARKVAQIALLAGAARVILAHNHPSGNVAPSQADITQTDKVRKALSIVGIDLIEHIIMAPDMLTFYAFSAEKKGMLQRAA